MATNTLVLSEAARTLRRLAEIQLDDPVFVSVYVNLDPARFGIARERESQLDSLMHELRSWSLDDSVQHDARTAFEADVDRIEQWTKNEMDAQGVHGVAIFASSGSGLFETVGVAAPVGPSVHVDRTAHIEPLISVIPAEAWCVLLVNRRTGRILRGSRDRVDEIAEVHDDVHGQHDQGGWSQRRYERSVEKEVKDHVQNVCDRLFEVFKSRPFDKLLIGCPAELRPEVESKLHPYLVERLADHFEGEVEHANDADVTERVRPLIEMDERRAEAQIIERLSEQLGRSDRAAAGIGAVLGALNAKAVEILLLAPGAEAPGYVCAQCEWLATSGGTCPVDDAPLVAVDNVVAPAARSAVLQSATVHEVRYHEPDTALSAPFAALLRFDVPT